MQKIQNFTLVPGVKKTDCLDFSGFFTEKVWKIENRNFFPEIAISRNRNLVGLVIASDRTWESRVRRPGNQNPAPRRDLRNSAWRGLST